MPLAISSDSDSNSDSDDDDNDEASDQASVSEPRRSDRVKKKSRVAKSQQWQIDYSLIPEPGARAKARDLNAKKRRQTQTSQLVDEFDLLE